jgi:hypothetical protein
LGLLFERWNEPGVKPAESSALVAANDDKMASFCNRALVGSKKKKRSADASLFFFSVNTKKSKLKNMGVSPH